MSNQDNTNSAMSDALARAQQASPAREGAQSVAQNVEQPIVQPQVQPQAQFTDFQQGQSNMQNNPNGATFDWASFDDLLPSGIDMLGGGATINKVAEAWRELVKDKANNLRFPCQFTTIQADKHAVALSSLVVSGTWSGQAFAYVFLSGDRELEPRIHRDMQQRPIEVIVTPGDVFSSEYCKVVQDVLMKDKSVNNVNIVGASVLPRDLDVEDDNAILSTLHVAVSALMTTARTKLDPNATVFNYDTMLDKTNLKTRMDFSDVPTVDQLGTMHRADVKITLSRRQPGRDAHSQDIVVPMTHVSGFVDLHYVNPQSVQQTPQGMYNGMQQMQMPGQVQPSYLARFVMTHVASAVGAKTPEILLMGMSSANIVTFNGNAWKYALKPNTARTSHDRRDIGALAYDVPTSIEQPQWRGKINTKVAKFDDGMLQILLQNTVLPQLGFAIDCHLVGEVSWITNLWIRAAQGNAEAIKRIIKHANNLTNNRFQAHWDNNKHLSQGLLFSSELTKLHVGTYIDPVDGSLRPLSDWDELAVLNYLGDKELNRAQQFGSTFDISTLSEEERMEERLRILKAISPSVKVDGSAYRLTPARAFITSLGASLSENATINNQPEITGVVTENAQRGQTELVNFAMAGVGDNVNNMYRMFANNGQTGQPGVASFTPFL